MPNRTKIPTTIANEDAALIKLGEAAASDEMFSAETVRRIVFGGENTIKVIRELRGLSQRELAKQVKSSSAAANAAQPLPPQVGADRKSDVFLRLREKHLRSTCGSQGMGESARTPRLRVGSLVCD